MISAQSKLAYLETVSTAIWIDDSVLVGNPLHLDALAIYLDKVDADNRRDFDEEVKRLFAHTASKIYEEILLRGQIKGRASSYKKAIKEIENTIKFIDQAILYFQDHEYHPIKFLEHFSVFPDNSSVTYQKFENAARSGSLIDLKEELSEKVQLLKSIPGQYQMLIHELIYALIVTYNKYNSAPAKRAYSAYDITRVSRELRRTGETGPFYRFVGEFMQILCDEVCGKLEKKGFLQKGSTQEALLRDEFCVPTKIIRTNLDIYYSSIGKLA